MSSSIAHRGPDDEGFVFYDATSKTGTTYSSQRSPSRIADLHPVLPGSYSVPLHHLAMGHVRYSIIDLSPGGHQPMWSRCGNVCLTFNGEIYNYVELRDELLRTGYRFATQSDTEVLLAGYLAWGNDVWTRVNGFFAVALLDKRRNALLLARDRLGKATLYVHRRAGESIYWASEIKAFLAAGCMDATRVDASAVADFAFFSRRDRAGTFWQDVEDFPPGHVAWVSSDLSCEFRQYWKLPATRLTPSDLSQEDAALGLRDLLTEALRLRMRADVPVGFELSGGMDSSALVALAAGRLREQIAAYTIDFEQAHSSEEPFARAVAQHHAGQIDYRVIEQPKDHFWEEADRFVWLQEEPFHSPNLHTDQYLKRVMKAYGAHVVITGTGGDEVLAGYALDYFSPYLTHLLRAGNIRNFFAEIAANTEYPGLRGMKAMLGDMLFSEERRVRRWQSRSGEATLLARVFTKPVLSAPSRRSSLRGEKSFHGRTLANMTHRLMNYWLRASSKSDYGIPIETRSPFLDYRVVEYCCRLPPEHLIRSGWHKHSLREAVKDFLPQEVVWRRRKMGFPFPYREWLAASRSLVETNVRGLECPLLSADGLLRSYDELLRIAPITLWRIVSLVLWWRRVIEQRPLLAGHTAASRVARRAVAGA